MPHRRPPDPVRGASSRRPRRLPGACHQDATRGVVMNRLRTRCGTRNPGLSLVRRTATWPSARLGTPFHTTPRRWCRPWRRWRRWRRRQHSECRYWLLLASDRPQVGVVDGDPRSMGAVRIQPTHELSAMPPRSADQLHSYARSVARRPKRRGVCRAWRNGCLTSASASTTRECRAPSGNRECVNLAQEVNPTSPACVRGTWRRWRTSRVQS